MTTFDDIRPYTDEEIPEVMRRLSENKLLLGTMRMIKWPNCPRIITPLVEWVVGLNLKRKLSSISSVNDFQQEVTGKMLVPFVISHSISELTTSGLETLDPDKPYIFFSNHRDIVLDSALVNYVVNSQHNKVPYIAFGDNLLVNDLVTDLIKVNKAFIVKRDLPPKEQLKELKHLSEYIAHIREQGDHFWIAQRQGRAKDGIDVTNPAMFKMLHLAKRKIQPDFSAFIQSCNIVPVSISYEKDPCDRLKAWELYRKSKRGVHKKRKNEDFISMSAGIFRDKGKVHISFGQPVSGSYENEKDLALEIDQIIQHQYQLWPANYVAYDITQQSDKYTDRYTEEDKNMFLERFKGLNRKVREYAMMMYANPVISKEGRNTKPR